MSDIWAARKDDELIHTSPLADIASAVAEVAVYSLATAAVAAAAAAAAPALAGVAVLGAAATAASGCVGAGLIVGFTASLTGVGEHISNGCDTVANWLFPPVVSGVILTGSANVFTNAKPAARAAGRLLTADEIKALPAPQPPQSFWDYGSELLAAGGNIISQLWQPSVAGPSLPSQALEEDKIACDKHPSPQYLAEGSGKVFINGQPAVRSNDRSTCEAKVSTDVSKNVLIGGDAVVVRDIKSGKLPGIGLALTVLPLLLGNPSKLVKNLPCMIGGGLAAAGANALGEAIHAAFNPVHAATGAKVLNGEEDIDLLLSARFPLVWQRNYNSRNRYQGLFGHGWRTPFEIWVDLADDGKGGVECCLHDETGRELRFPLPEVNKPSFNAGEGLMFRSGEEGQLVIADTDGSVWRLFVPLPQDPSRLRLMSLSDEYDNALLLSYDEQQRLSQISDSANAMTLLLEYADARFADRVTALCHNQQTRVRYCYNDTGDLHQVVDAGGLITREFHYNDQSLLTRHQQAGGPYFEYRWAMFDDWRVVEHRDEAGGGCSIDYDLAAGLTTVTEYDGLQHSHRWNSQQLITEYTDERGEVWRYQWNDEDMLVASQDPLGHGWQFRYDEAGNLVEEQDPLGNIRLTQWLPQRALPVSIKAPNGATQYFYYDQRHALVADIDALGHTQRYLRDDYGQVVQSVDANGGISHFAYDEHGQLIRARDCSGKQTTYSYLPQGWLTEVTDAAGESTRYHYDSAGRLTQLQRAEGWQEKLGWNEQGQLVHYQGADGRLTHYRYDSVGRLLATRNPLDGEVLRSYDTRGRLTALRNENGESYGFQWTAANLLQEETGLDGISTRYRYDECRRVIERTFAANTPAAFSHYFSHDAAGQLLNKQTPDGETRYRYNPVGQLLHAAFYRGDVWRDFQPEAESETSFSYDLLGRVLSEQANQGTLNYDYDPMGNRTQIALPDGRTLRSLYYGSSHLLQVALDDVTISEFERDNLHRELSRTQGRLTSRLHYDRLGRKDRREIFNDNRQRPAPASSSRQWFYDYQNNLTREEQNANPFAYQRYHYDAAGRLLSQDGTLPDTERYRYDPASNLLDEGQFRQRHNRVMHYQGIDYRYDTFGRTVEKRKGHYRWQYRYDAEHRLCEVVRYSLHRSEPQQHVQFRYDPLGRRTQKQVWLQSQDLRQPGGKRQTTTFLWEGFRLLQETRDGMPLTYVYADQGSYEPLARIDGGPQAQVFYFHTAPNGEPESLTDSNGTLRWQGHSSAWGNTKYEENQQHLDYSQNLRLQGQYLDRETGLHYNLFRYYDPDIGRFTQHDPIGLAGGINLYQYAPNPLGWVDPLGLSKCNAPNGYKTGDVDPHGNLSPGLNRALGHTNSKTDGFVQSHHPIQDAWARKRIDNYQRNSAPATLLKSSSGSPHAKISAAQRVRRASPGGWDTTLKQEFNTSYKEMIDAGVSPRQARKSISDSYKYFDGIRESNLSNVFFDI
ncbi:RHS repeat-associated core domain-containing protein [Serratia quinivorans]|uniref:RHS repeat-associated core domain-containing protein n=1 Tax=Serratia quinivorans TaxID=137545 RepID=UPI0021781F69|nr:RHS repeat-associated core domain-containing protein [Serratia quinivorans]CAI0751716.1 Cell wall-associated polypeptide CWBP200 [Serratia quinivorans]CAI0773066.1 Cell wall-associated polypeptide CWBP200 [Serratia quinivorans]CAI1681268.1 Cell wall-associated polypeptide CWBP200 [Serratia quinivorans]CAI2102380.1 Cell wall-associated polypeptide CWBP200 [Serratia quinivorans]